jgi:hypothetical protein
VEIGKDDGVMRGHFKGWKIGKVVGPWGGGGIVGNHSFMIPTNKLREWR